jgi:Tfp pilus assembly protein PilF
MLIVAIIFILLHLLAGVIDPQALWGVDSWYYSGTEVTVSLAIFSIFALIPQVNKKIYFQFEKLAKKLDRIPFYYYVIAFGIIFYLFHQTTYFLGDGYLRIKNTNSGMLLTPEQPLDTMLHTITLYLVNKVISSNAGDIFRAYSIISGMFFVGGLIYYAKKLIENVVHRWMFILIVLFQGYILLYFGYVESYSIMFTLSFLAAMAALLMIKEKTFSVIPIILSVASILFHPISGMYLPAIIYAYYISIDDKAALRWASVVGIVILPIVALVVGFVWGGMAFGRFEEHYFGDSRMLSLFGDENGLGIFTFNHILELFNSLLLAVPVVIFLPFISWKANKRNVFLWISMGISFLFVSTVNSGLGVSRDWDLFSLISIPVVLFVGIGLIKTEDRGNTSNRLMFLVLVVSILHTVPWLSLNSSQEKSISRAKNMLDSPGWSSAHNTRLADAFATYYDNREELDSAEVYINLAYKYEPNPRYIFGLAYFEQKRNNYHEAIRLYESIQGKFSRKAYSTNVKLAELYYATKQFKKAGDSYKKALELNSKETVMYFNMALSYISAKMVDDAIWSLEELLKREPDHKDALYNLSNLYYKSDEFMNAAKYFKRIQKLEPQKASMDYNLAVCYVNTGDFETGLKYANLARDKGYEWNTISAMIKDINLKIKNRDKKLRK